MDRADTKADSENTLEAVAKYYGIVGSGADNATSSPMHSKAIGQIHVAKHYVGNVALLKMRAGKQRYAKWLLYIILGICSLWQVREVLVKFIEGSTTTTLEQRHNSHLPLPKVAFCLKQRYKYEALAAMGLPADYFSENRHRTEFDTESQFPELNETWLKATWSREDLQIAAATGATHTDATLVTNTEGIISNKVWAQQTCGRYS